MERYLSIATFCLMTFIIIMVTAVVTYLYKQDLAGMIKGRYRNMRQKNQERALQDIDKKVSYNMIDEMLLKKGAKYRMGDNFSPFDYTVLRLLIGCLLALVALVVHPVWVVAGFILGYLIVPFYFNYENRHDSAEMMDDIASMFGIVSLQLKNGVFLSKVIYECYLSTEHPRLKKALLELSLEMEKFGNVKEAAVSFRSKFEDKYLDTFSKTLEQADETGNAVDLLKDIESQIDGINEAIAIREEHKVNSRSFILQTLVFVGTMLFVVYIVVQMFGTMVTVLT